MRIMPHKIISVLLAVAAAQCSAQNSGPVDRLLDQIARQERSFLQRLRTYSPVVETYLQELSEGGDAPSAADHYFLGKADFSKGIGIGYSSFVARTKAQKHFLTFLQKGKSTAFTPEGFAQMLLIDSENFDRVPVILSGSYDYGAPDTLPVADLNPPAGVIGAAYAGAPAAPAAVEG